SSLSLPYSSLHLHLSSFPTRRSSDLSLLLFNHSLQSAQTFSLVTLLHLTQRFPDRISNSPLQFTQRCCFSEGINKLLQVVSIIISLSHHRQIILRLLPFDSFA